MPQKNALYINSTKSIGGEDNDDKSREPNDGLKFGGSRWKMGVSRFHQL